MSDKPISPLRRRMIEDMTVRNFVEKTRNDYIRHVRTFTAFLGRSPDKAVPQDLRRFQLHQTQTGVRSNGRTGAQLTQRARTAPSKGLTSGLTAPRFVGTDPDSWKTKMSLSDRPLSRCTEADLLALIADGQLEGKTLDYKRGQVGKSEAEKKEFLYDASSFANAMGGHLVFGMEEKDGAPVALVGLPGVNVDDEILRLEQMMRDGIRPPIIGVRTVPVRLASGASALVMYIPKSWNPPHQVTYQKAFLFYGRNSNGKYRLDVDELRSIYTFSASAAERLKLFRIDRAAKIVAGDTPRPLPAGGKTVTHIVPLSAFASAQVVDLNRAWREHFDLIVALGGHGPTNFNLDGLFASAQFATGWRYAQLFRDGCIEIVDAFSDEANKRTWLPVAFEKQIIQKLSQAKRLFQELEIAPPIVVMLTLLGMKGWKITTQSEASDPLDRDPIFIPEIVLDSFDGVPQNDLKPLFDMVWNAGGAVGSPSYDNLGRRNDM
jgi:hypothetical protein